MSKAEGLRSQSATCPSCGCHQPDSLLCWQDTEALLTMFAAIPALVDELQVAISKQAKISNGGKSGKGSAHTKSPVNFGALAVRDALLVELALWGDDIDEIRRHPQAAEIVSGVGKAVKNAYRCIDRMADRKYLGRCNATIESDTASCECACHGNGAYPPPCSVPGGCGPHTEATECTAELWAKPGAHQVKCQQCGYVHSVGDRRADMLEVASEMLFSPKEASQLLGEVGGIRVTEASIRGYVHRKRIAYRPGTKMIRLGDLLAVVVDDGERRSA